MGVWCDSLRNQLNEETGAVMFARNMVAWLYACFVVSQPDCDDFILPLTCGRLMGVCLRIGLTATLGRAFAIELRGVQQQTMKQFFVEIIIVR
jgi:hypothetical protein